MLRFHLSPANKQQAVGQTSHRNVDLLQNGGMTWGLRTNPGCASPSCPMSMIRLGIGEACRH